MTNLPMSMSVYLCICCTILTILTMFTCSLQHTFRWWPTVTAHKRRVTQEGL